MTLKHFISTEDYSMEELNSLIKLAFEMKRHHDSDKWSQALKQKCVILFFANPSLRTHLSFDTAINQLGGHGIYRTPEMGWIKTHEDSSGESLKDAAIVMSKYADALCFRITQGAVSKYGEAHQLLQAYARWAEVPVISMADDTYHPCQALADIMGWSEALSVDSEATVEALRGKKVLITWAKSGLVRPWSSVQSHILLAARAGMNVTLAYPEGYDLDERVVTTAKNHCYFNQKSFKISHDPIENYKDADVVYVRNWISPNAYHGGQFNAESEVKQAIKYKDWMTSAKKMELTNQAILANPMPVDRNNEIEEGLVDNYSRTVIYEVAKNRLFVQKAILHSLLKK